MTNEGKQLVSAIGAILIGIAVLGLFVLAGFVGYRYYAIWSQEMQGRAILAQAAQTKQVLIEQARAEKEAALERAEAIRIVGEAAQKYPEYRHQEFIGAFAQALQDGKINQIIYVPTEGNIPIIEPARMLKQSQQ